jgi:hypothetical protein
VHSREVRSTVKGSFVIKMVISMKEILKEVSKKD